MRITERRLRRIIRSVIIEEQKRLDERFFKDTAIGLGMAGMTALGGMSGLDSAYAEPAGIEAANVDEVRAHDVKELFGTEEALYNLNKKSRGELLTLLRRCFHRQYDSVEDVAKWVDEKSGMEFTLGSSYLPHIIALGELSFATWQNNGRLPSNDPMAKKYKRILSPKSFKALKHAAENGMMMISKASQKR